MEIVTRGGDGLEPVFDLSAAASWQLQPRVALTTDYFSAAATTRHLPEPDAHHLLFGGVDLDLGAGWELTLSAGHCLSRREPWLMKSIVAIGF